MGPRGALHRWARPAIGSDPAHGGPGARRLPTQNILNFRVEKRQKIGPGTAAFQLDLFNVTNTNVELGVTARSGANFNKITSIVPPFVAKLGVVYNF